MNSFGLSQVKHVIAVSSCKGGVGKSTVSAQLALQLAAQGLRVGLMDADIYGPSVPTLFHLFNVPIYENEFKMLDPVEKNGIKLMSFGFLLGDAPAVLRGPIVTRYIQQLLFQTSWGELDYLIIDMPPGTGDVQLTITQQVQLTGAIIVTTRQALSLVDVARGILMFEKVKVPILGIVDNMAFFTCSSCKDKHYIFGDAKLALKDRFGVEVIAELPIDKKYSYLANDFVSTPEVAHLANNLLASVKRMEANTQEVPAIRFDQSNIYLTYKDGREDVLDNRNVRLACQCALCVDEISGKKILNPSKVKPDIAPTAITPLGNYAIGIDFNDGHNSGIYPYSLLKALL